MENIRTWLADIQQAIEEINSFLPSDLTFENFQNDLQLKRAIEREIEMIGEAMNRILRVDPEYKITEARIKFSMAKALGYSV